MRPPDLTAAEMPAYLAALNTSTDHEFRVDVLTLDHVPVETVTATLVDGSAVNLNPDADVDRSGRLIFDDPDHRLQIDNGDPTDGAVGFDRLMQVTHSMFVPLLDRWVDCPAGTFVPTVPERAGDTVEIEVQDKAIRMLAPRDIPPYTIREGSLVVNQIRDCAERCGETRFAFPTGITNRVGKNRAVGGEKPERAPWKVMRDLAKAADLQLFYDAAGTLRLRRESDTPIVTLTHDDTSTITDTVRIRTDFTQIRNRVVVTGKKGVKADYALPDAHPFSSWALRSNGVRCRMTLFYNDPDLGTDAKALAAAKRELGNAQIEVVEVRTSAVPFYHGEPRDALQIDADSWSQVFRLRESSIPLGDGSMSIGYQRRVKSPALNRIR